MKPMMDDAQTDARTVTLSDGSVWTLEVSRVSGMWWHRIGDVLQLRLPQLTGQLPLTAADHRKIADVLDPAAALASPRAMPEVHPDTMRLDWLDAQREAEWHAEQRSETEVEQVLDYFYWQTRGQYNDIRSAIDNDERRAKLPKPPMTDADFPF